MTPPPLNLSIELSTIRSGYTWVGYRELVDRLLGQNQTTGTNHSEDMLHYTRLNVRRSDRAYQQVELLPEAEAAIELIDRPVVWMVLTEWWCGDAAQIVPVFARLAERNSQVELRFLLRDEHPDLMNHFLTNGGKAIPILACIDAETGSLLGHWGPRPKAAQALVLEYKANPGTRTYAKFAEELHLWYARNKTHDTQREFAEAVRNWFEQL
jgi:hypothetical protein